MQHPNQQHIVCIDHGHPVETGHGAPVFGHVAWPVPVPANPEEIILAAPGEDGSPELVSAVIQNICLALVGVGLLLLFALRLTGRQP